MLNNDLRTKIPRGSSFFVVTSDLQWLAPEEGQWKGLLQGYVIRYKPSGYPDYTYSYETIYNLSNLCIPTDFIIVFWAWGMFDLRKKCVRFQLSEPNFC